MRLPARSCRHAQTRQGAVPRQGQGSPLPRRPGCVPRSRVRSAYLIKIKVRRLPQLYAELNNPHLALVGHVQQPPQTFSPGLWKSPGSDASVWQAGSVEEAAKQRLWGTRTRDIVRQPVRIQLHEGASP